MGKNSLTRNILTKVIPTTTDKRSMFHSTLPYEVGVKLLLPHLKVQFETIKIGVILHDL